MMIDLAGESVDLRADRTLFWPGRRTLILADPHFGKADAFRAASVPVPGDCTASLARLDLAIEATAANRLVILGDFWHAREGCTPLVIQDLVDWRNRHVGLRIDLIRGNHDRATPPPNWVSAWHHGEMIEGPFAFSHHPSESEGVYTLAGHLHPGIRLQGRGRQRVRLPCYWIGSRVTVLPAFGEFTGLMAVTPGPDDRVFAIAGEEVIALDP